MDYNDIQSGITQEHFINKAQLYLIETLLEKIKTRNAKILSIGCGDGNELKILKKHGAVDILDIDRKVIKLIPKEDYSKVYIHDVCTFKTKNKYDLIAGFDVLEHIKNDKKAINNIYKLLKKWRALYIHSTCTPNIIQCA